MYKSFLNLIFILISFLDKIIFLITKRSILLYLKDFFEMRAYTELDILNTKTKFSYKELRDKTAELAGALQMVCSKLQMVAANHAFHDLQFLRGSTSDVPLAKRGSRWADSRCPFGWENSHSAGTKPRQVHSKSARG